MELACGEGAAPATGGAGASAGASGGLLGTVKTELKSSEPAAAQLRAVALGRKWAETAARGAFPAGAVNLTCARLSALMSQEEKSFSSRDGPGGGGGARGGGGGGGGGGTPTDGYSGAMLRPSVLHWYVWGSVQLKSVCHDFYWDAVYFLGGG